MLPIIDAHHHIWLRKDLPWLIGPMIPRIFGPYESIRRDYTIAEYLEDRRDSGVVKSVYVQTNWPVERFEDEAAWVQGTADETGWPHAIVAYADFLADDIRAQLDRLARYRLVRGVRMQLHWHDNPEYRFASRPDLVDDVRFRRNFERFRSYGLSFDLQLFPGQLALGARLAADYPGVSFILLHAGMLEDPSPGAVETWRAGMAGLASLPNVCVKLSGLGTFLRRNDPAHIAAIVRECVAAFGPGRCMFGSNFPIEKLWTDFRSLTKAYEDALSVLDAAAANEVRCGTAARVYRI